MSFSSQDIALLKQAKAQGKTKEQALAQLTQSRTNAPVAEEPAVTTDTTMSRLNDVGTDVGNTISQALAGQGQFQGKTPLNRGVSAVASGFSAVPRGALAMAPEPVRSGVEKVGDFVGKGFKKLTGAIGSTDLFQGAAGRTEMNENNIPVYKTNDLGMTEDALGVASGIGEIAGTIAGTQGVISGITKTGNIARTGFKSIDNALTPTPTPNIKVPKPRVGEIINRYRAQLSDIDPKYETVLRSQSDPDKVMEYFDQAERAAVDSSVPMATTIASRRAVDAFDAIKNGASEAGKLKSDLLGKIDTVKVQGNIPGNAIDNLKNTVNERYGISIDKNGNIQQSGGRVISVDNKSQALISDYVTELRKLGQNPTARQLDDFVDRVQRQLYKQSSPNLLEVADEPVTAYLKQLTGEINSQLKTNVDAALTAKGLPADYGKLNQQYTDLLDINNRLNKRLGTEGDKGASLMKSLFSPQTGESTRRLFQEIKDTTSIDLFEEATLARFVMESVGDTRSKSLLQEIDAISGDVSKLNLMEPGSWLNFIREKADLDGRELADQLIRESSDGVQK